METLTWLLEITLKKIKEFLGGIIYKMELKHEPLDDDDTGHG